MPAIHHIAAVAVSIEAVIVDSDVADGQIIRLHVDHGPHGRVNNVNVLQIDVIAKRGPDGDGPGGLDAGSEIGPPVSVDRSAARDSHIAATLRIDQSHITVVLLAVVGRGIENGIITGQSASQQRGGRINEQRHIIF